MATQEWVKCVFQGLLHQASEQLPPERLVLDTVKVHLAVVRTHLINLDPGPIITRTAVVGALRALMELHRLEDLRAGVAPSCVEDEIMALRAAGQREYAGGLDAFGNFNRLSEELFLKREQVLWVYLQKHMDGITAHVEHGHRSQREPVQGRIKDVMVYLLLLWAMKTEGAASDE